jgi:hypothetical protein
MMRTLNYIQTKISADDHHAVYHSKQFSSVIRTGARMQSPCMLQAATQFCETYDHHAYCQMLIIAHAKIVDHRAYCKLLVYRASTYAKPYKSNLYNHENSDVALMTFRAKTILLMITSPRHMRTICISATIMRVTSARIYDRHTMCTP